MLCQRCNKEEVTIRITKMVNGKVEDLSLCPGCAAEVSTHAAKLMQNKVKDLLSVEHLLKEMIAEQAGALAEVEEELAANSVCPSCGLSFSSYKQTCMLGCPDCYDSFGPLLEADIRKLHGATEHQGERVSTPPAEVIDLQARVRMMREELEECVANEDFERAAVLRDQIRLLTEQGGGVPQ